MNGFLHDALHAAGTQAASLVDLWRWTLLICGAVFAAVLAAFAYALLRSARGNRDTPPLPGGADPRRQRIVAAATGVSALLLFVLVGASVATDRRLAQGDLGDALRIEVTAHQWWWELRYDDGEVSQQVTTANELHVPVGRTVLLTLAADDVIHSLWLPSLGGKKDLVPGRPTTHVLRASVPGRHRGQCAEFCGAQHAWMVLELVAEPPADYDAWLQAQRRTPPPPQDARLRRGERVFEVASCPMCHAVAGTVAGGRHAPDLTHVASRARIAAGALDNTPENLARWITDPQQIKPGVNMPANRLSNDDLQALVAWLRSLK